MTGFDGLPAATQEELQRTYQKRASRRMVLVGKIDNTIETGRDFFIWVRDPASGAEEMAYDSRHIAPRYPGTPIHLKEREGAWGRYEVDTISDSAPSMIIAQNTGSAALSYGGVDQLIVDQRQIKQGLIHQTNPPSMKYTLTAFKVREGGKVHEIAGQDSDTISAPSAGNARWDVVSINLSSWTLTTTAGWPFDKNYPESGSKPYIPTGEMFLGYLRITDETTSLRDAKNIHPELPYFSISGVFQTSISSSANTSGPGTYYVDTGDGAVTLTLDSDDCVDGRRITIKDTGNGATANITIDTEGVEAIDGSASQTISSDYGLITVEAYDGDWHIV